MAVPTSPYCASNDVAILLQQLLKYASDFSASTQPTKVVVEKLITWKSAEIDMAFASIGFYVPYEEISGESWPSLQTNMLELMCSFGAAGMVAGPVLKPAPAMGRDSGKSPNAYTAAYDAFIASIPTNAAGFRMKYRPGTKSEQITRTPRGPIPDHLLGYIDPTRFQTATEYTEMIMRLRRTEGIDTTSPQWDHLKTVRDGLLA